MFTEVKISKTYEKILEQFKNNIRNKTLRKGTKLPPERAMAEQMGVSRLTVREALSYLSAMGIIENKVGDGNYISTNLEHVISEPLHMYSMLEDVDIAEVADLRAALQAYCIPVCAERMTDEQVDELAAVCDQFKGCACQEDLVAVDKQFHACIVRGTALKLANVLYNSLSSLIQEHLTVVWAEAIRQNMVSGMIQFHERIVDAVRRRDPQAARDSMRVHFQYLG